MEHVLKEVGLRSTRDRRELLNLFADDRTWTAKQLHEQLSDINLSTIYRNLQIFSDNELIRPVHIHDNEQYYERVRDTHHDHLSCDECEILKCIPCPAPELQNHHIELTGVCSACA